MKRKVDIQELAPLIKEVVDNLETGSVMYSKNASDMVYPASTVKLMTAIVASASFFSWNSTILA